MTLQAHRGNRRWRQRGRAGCCSCCGTARRPAPPRPAHKAVVDKYAGQLLADRSWISTAATALSTPPESPQITRPSQPARGCRRSWHRGSWPSSSRRRSRIVPHEIGEKLAAVGRMHDLGVEHEAVALRLLVGGDGVWRAFRTGDDSKPARAARRDRRGSSRPDATRRHPQAVEQG